MQNRKNQLCAKLTNLRLAKGFSAPISVCIWNLTSENQGYIPTYSTFYIISPSQHMTGVLNHSKFWKRVVLWYVRDYWVSSAYCVYNIYGLFTFFSILKLRVQIKKDNLRYFPCSRQNDKLQSRISRNNKQIL